MSVVVKSRPLSTATMHAEKNGSTPSLDLVGRILSVGFLVAALAVAAQTVGHLANAFFFDYGIWNLDATGDGNALSWASSVATFAAALSAFLLGSLFSTPGWRFLALAAVLAFFSLDDVVGIHEKLAFADYGVDIPSLVRRAFWPLLYVPLFAFVAITLWQLSVRAQDRIRQTIRLGLALLAVALVAEAIATLWWSDDSNYRPLVDDLEVALEEGAELGGWILLATGLLAVLGQTVLGLRARGELSPPADEDGLRQ